MRRTYVSFEPAPALVRALNEADLRENDHRIIRLVQTESVAEAARQLVLTEGQVRHRYLRAWDLVSEIVGMAEAQSYFMTPEFK